MSLFKKNENINDILDCLKKSYNLSVEINNYSLTLKIMILWRKFDNDKRFSIDEVQNIFNNIQGLSYTLRKKKIISYLTK